MDSPAWTPSSYLIEPVIKLSRYADRAPASAGHAEAEKVLVRDLTQLNLTPAFGDKWTQPIFSAGGKVVGANIGGIIKGSNDQYIALIAHYDTVLGSPGADDNAAAIGITLEVIKQLNTWNGNCNILVLFPDLEEPPNFYTGTMGSTYFYNHSLIPVDKIRCAIVMDLVGHDLRVQHREDSLFVMGAETSGELLTVVNHASKEVPDLQVYPVRNEVVGLDLSDHHVFALNQRPFLFLSCGMGPKYHAMDDTFENISPAKMFRISQFVFSLLMQIDREQVSGANQKPDLQAVLKAEADSYERFAELDPINVDVTLLNDVGNELMQIVNSGTYFTLAEVKERITRRVSD